MILDSISIAICLCLDVREEQALSVIEQYGNVGIDVQPFICGKGKLLKNYNHIDTNDLPPIKRFYYDSKKSIRIKAFNCWKCHNKIFQYFRDNYGEQDNLLLIEDDAILTEDFLEIIECADEYFKENEFDMLYLGSHHTPKSFKKTENPTLLKVSGCGGFHSVIINYNVVKELLTYGPVTAYDDICARIIQKKYRCYSIYPAIVTQHVHKSSIEEGRFTGHDRWWLGNENISRYVYNQWNSK